MPDRIPISEARSPATSATSLPAVDDGRHTGRGVAFMLIGSLFLTSADALTKFITEQYPLGEVVFLRSLIALPLIVVMAWHFGGLAMLRVNRWRPQLARATCGTASEFVFLFGLMFLPLADAVAVAFSGPLFITALAIPFLGEQVRWRRWTAILVGFAGVLIIVQPTSVGFRPEALITLAAVMMGAGRDLITRRYGRQETPFSMLLLVMTGMTIAGAVTLPFAWQTPDLVGLGWIALAGTLYATSQYFTIEAFRLAEASRVAPFKYAMLLWSVLLGFVIWGDVPGVSVAFGAVLLIGSGLYLLRRERSLRR